MATAKEFVQQLLLIPGIKSYCLVRPDGKALAHNFGDADQTALIHLGGKVGEAIRRGMGLQHFRHLELRRASQEHLLIFPVEQHLLGITQRRDATTDDLVEQIYHFLMQFSRPSTAATADRN
ncbi:hypothetical protein JCM30471_07470 [Desulfuromonas carbonis]|uniref:hypothetical protein n=1 Tax=Desulfuromonas sp. DDH964 TaxID=1823759 RepID=UPI00078CF2A9|nr:hypothetical protein [Desulfuromonas sp. DDH964]AMV72263.1 hypothetical protein DBW_1910 [Desulfuromonas sp. DDH964]